MSDRYAQRPALVTPVRRIRGLAEVTLTTDASETEFENMAASTIEECDKLIDIINTMLDITEAEAGVNGVEAEEFELVTMIREACELFRPITEEKKINLKSGKYGLLGSY